MDPTQPLSPLSASTRQIRDREAWLTAHQEHLVREKAFTQQREELATARRELPWLEITEPYIFDSEAGEIDFLALFDSKSQLIVYHFMFGPDWGEEGCPICSFWADNYNGAPDHLAQRDTAFAVVSRASMNQIATYKQRMGWSFRWVSSGKTRFNYDLDVSTTQEELKAKALTYNLRTAKPVGPESPGLSVFARDGERIFLTHQVSARGLDLINGTYHLLDLTPKGRDEATLPWPMAWVRRHDSYPDRKLNHGCCQS